MEKICGIYMIKNLVNNKVYVGQSVDIDKRWKSHINRLNNNNHFNIYLQRAWNKYREHNFEFKIIEKCTHEELNNREIYWIDKLKSISNEYGYNNKQGGTSGSHTPESLKKMSEHRKGIKHTEEAKRKISLNNARHNLGKHHSTESKEKMSMARKGRFFGEQSPRSSITEEQALIIIDMLKKDMFVKDISEKTKISRHIISDIKGKITWTHLTNNIEFNMVSAKQVGKNQQGKILKDIKNGLTPTQFVEKYDMGKTSYYNYKRMIA